MIGHTVIVTCPHCGETNYYEGREFQRKLNAGETDTCVKCENTYTMTAKKVEVKSK